MLVIDNTDCMGQMKTDFAVFALHGDEIAKVIEPHATPVVGERVRIGGIVYAVENVTHDFGSSTSEFHLSR